MSEVPTLIDLCLSAIANELLLGDKSDDVAPIIYELPSELFNGLLPRLPSLALQRLQDQLPVGLREDLESANDNGNRERRRSGLEILDKSWFTLYKVRWPNRGRQKHMVALWDEHDKPRDDLVDDWQQLYWEAHLQDCMDAVAETASIPSYNGSVGEIRIPDTILEHIGCKDNLRAPKCDFLKFSHHCQQFGVYARCLRLPNALCIAETCELLRSSMLEKLELQWIKTSDHVEGLCKLLDQNCRSLRSIKFLHCKFSPGFIDAIRVSLHGKSDLQAHGIQHFSVTRSSFLQTDISPLPVGLSSIITGKWLDTLTLCDDQLGPNFARRIFNSLLDASASISVLDISDNNISGFLSPFRWGSSGRIGKSLPSLKVLNLRCCNLLRDDADCLKEALSYMPNLESLDLSDNAIKDGIRSLISYFSKISGREVPFSDLRLENCDLTCEQVMELLGTLSTMAKPLNLISIKGNRLGSEIGPSLGKFLCAGVKSLDIEDIGLGSSGFLRASKEISNESMVTHVNISNNEGGMETAAFISVLLLHAKKITRIDVRYDSMTLESLPLISSAFADSEGTLKHLDLRGNFFHQLADASAILAEYRSLGKKFPRNIFLSARSNEPYDHDP